MLNLVEYNIKKLEIFIMNFFEQSNKKHLLITGEKKIGKTTVLNEILKNENSFGGIMTYAVRDEQIPPKLVMLKDINNNEINTVIAIRNRLGTKLIPQIDNFNNVGRDILNKYCNNDKKIIVIDEIGFLEDTAITYQNQIMKCFEQKSVIAVIRKQETTFIKEILARKDIFLVDLDTIKNVFYKNLNN